jgi:hypothetical protein
VFEAVRRPRVVTVGIPLRRVTILGLLLSVPTLILHQQIEHLREGISESFTLPSWIWITVAAALLFLISRIHELAVHLTDRYFNRAVAQVGERLGNAILNAGNFAEIEGHLVHGAHSALGLASASVFREEGGVFQRSAEDQGWDGAGEKFSIMRKDWRYRRAGRSRRPPRYNRKDWRSSASAGSRVGMNG